MNKTIYDKLTNFFAQFSIHKYRKGEIVLHSDAQPQGLYFVKNGYVKMSTLYENGRELTLNIFQPGSFFPLIWAIGNIPNHYNFQTITLVELQCAPKQAVLDLLNKNNDIFYDLTKRILRGTDGLLTNIELMLNGDAYHKIMATIYLIAKRFGEKNGQSIVVKQIILTHQDIANFSGLTRETTSVILKKLIDQNYIAFLKHHIKILNMQKLENKLQVYRSTLISDITI